MRKTVKNAENIIDLQNMVLGTTASQSDKAAMGDKLGMPAGGLASEPARPQSLELQKKGS